MKRVVVTLALALATQAASALIIKSSPHNVQQTVDRLAATVEKAGAKVFARIDHAQGAANVGTDIPANQMLLFGNPKLGTPAIEANPVMGLDLPLRVQVYRDANGKVWLVYRDPGDVAASHGLSRDLPVVKKMRGALEKLTNAAVRP